MSAESEKLTLVISTGIALIAALAAVVQLRVTARQGRHNATFEHLGRVRRLQRRITEIDPEIARKSVIAWWKRETEDIPQPAKDYLELLDEYDFLGLAFKEGQVDRRIVIRNLRYTFRTPYFINREFIDEGKALYRNPNLYEDLDLLIQRCLRLTWGERFTRIRKRFDGRSKATAVAAVLEPDSGGGNASIPAASTTSEAGTEVKVLKIQSLSDKEVQMAETPAVPQTPISLPGSGAAEKHVESPAFRPPPPQPPPPPTKL